LSKNKLKAIFDAGFETVFTFVKRLEKIIFKQSKDIEKLKKQVKALEARLGQNSSNSNKPPSSDWPAKQRSLRGKSGKLAGGQKGHKGHNLKMVDSPDKITLHKVDICSSCGSSLDNIAPAGYRKRQVFDLPPIKVNVEEHRAEEKLCPYCGCKNEANFPEDISQPTQYGPRIKAILTYLNAYQLLPYERTSELFLDLFGIEIASSTIVNTNIVAFEALKDYEDKIKDKITASPVVCFDETGLYVDVSRWWLHSASTDYLTYYFPHPRRGRLATDDIGILPNFLGTAVHDGWDTYFKYNCSHGLCNVHHLRELKALKEFYNQKWAKHMASLLIKIKEAVDKNRDITDRLDKESLEDFKDRYDKIIEKGLKENPPSKARHGPKKRGRIGKSKAENLLYRLKEHWRETLCFMYDFKVPFDNSLAERDIRMTKLKQKISGTFRSADGAKTFCRIRGYISTVRKNSLSVIDAIQAAFEGNPFMISSES